MQPFCRRMYHTSAVYRQHCAGHIVGLRASSTTKWSIVRVALRLPAAACSSRMMIGAHRKAACSALGRCSPVTCCSAQGGEEECYCDRSPTAVGSSPISPVLIAAWGSQVAPTSGAAQIQSRTMPGTGGYNGSPCASWQPSGRLKTIAGPIVLRIATSRCIHTKIAARAGFL